MTELVRVACDHIAVEPDSSAVLTVPNSKTDQEGKGAYAWPSPDTMRRLATWREASGIFGGQMFRRIGVVRTKVRAVAPTEALWPQAGAGFQRDRANAARGEEMMASSSRSVAINYG